MRKMTVLSISTLAAMTIVVVLALSAAGPTAAGSESQKSGTNEELVARGEYLVDFGGCNDCHSPKVMTDHGPVPDPKRLLSGHPETDKLPKFDKELVAAGGWILFSPDLTAAVGPWGVSYSFNLTPDQNTGLGLWTEKMFIGAMRTGKHMGSGRPIQPPMPWPGVGQLTDEDLSAIFAYLRSIPPVKNTVPGPMSLDDYSALNE